MDRSRAAGQEAAENESIAPVVLALDIWRDKKTGVRVEVLRIYGQAPDEAVRIRAMGGQCWSTTIAAKNLFRRYALVTDGPLRGSGEFRT